MRRVRLAENARFRDNSFMATFRHIGNARLSGFVLMELAAVVSILVALGALFTVWSGALARKADVVRCLANGRQMMQAFALYAQDHGGLLAPNEDVTVQGHSWFGSVSGSPAETNRFLPSDPRVNLLAPYATHSKIWKCPADPNFFTFQGRRICTVRSVSMNVAVGTACVTGTHNSPPTVRTHGAWLDGVHGHMRDTKFRTFGRDSEFVRPGETYVFIEEHPPSLNDGAFGTPGYDPKNPGASTIRWVDYPAIYHGDAGSFSFADGHAELRRWRNLVYPAAFTIPDSFVSPSERNDWEWLATHTTQPLR